MRARKATPANDRIIAGSVRSWKTEGITFEVNGRVQWVVEPGEEIEGRVYDAEGNLLSPGTQIAQLDDARFQSAVESARSKLNVEMLKRDSVQIQIDSVLPAEFAAANADLELARTEYERNQRLVDQNAGIQKNLDQAKAAFGAAQAAISGLEAKEEQVKSELKSAEAAIGLAEQALKDAERDLADTKLYSAFRGQIAETFVVPGSLVGPQSQVVTIQMMNPIQVEFEVSADVSRRIRLGDTIPVSLPNPDAGKQTIEAIVYAIAPAADNATRTFTLTLLVPNRKIELPVPSKVQGPIATTSFLWRLDLNVLPETPPGTWYMPEDGLFDDDQGTFVWRVANLKAGQPAKRVLDVEKFYVRPGNISRPFLGMFRFREVVIEDSRLDPTADLFAGDLQVEDGDPTDWRGQHLLLEDRGRWLLRPGDLVDVNLSATDQTSGIYVPIDAIRKDAGQTSVFAIETVDGSQVARQVAVRVIASNPSEELALRRIEAEAQNESLIGASIVVDGAHYLVDGDAVTVTREVGEE